MEVHSLPLNLGFCKGNNVGLNYSKGSYIVLLNNDTYVSQTWLEELVNTMDSNPSIGICQSKIVDFEGKNPLYGNILGVYGNCTVKSSSNLGDGIVEIAFYASGTSLIIRRTVIEKVGYLFDEAQYSGDLDLSWCVHLIGLRVVTNVNSVCYHYHSYSSKIVLRNPVNVRYVVFKDLLQSYTKNYDFAFLIRRVPIFIYIGFIESLYLSIEYRSPVVYGMLKGLFWNIFNLADTWRKHVKIQLIRTTPDSSIENAMLPYPSELYFIKQKLK